MAECLFVGSSLRNSLRPLMSPVSLAALRSVLCRNSPALGSKAIAAHELLGHQQSLASRQVLLRFHFRRELKLGSLGLPLVPSATHQRLADRGDAPSPPQLALLQAGEAVGRCKSSAFHVRWGPSRSVGTAPAPPRSPARQLLKAGLHRAEVPAKTIRKPRLISRLSGEKSARTDDSRFSASPMYQDASRNTRKP